MGRFLRLRQVGSSKQAGWLPCYSSSSSRSRVVSWRRSCGCCTTTQSTLKIPATYMRGGTSKGLFFRCQDLPRKAQVPGEYRDQLLLRVMGSPDPYSKQIDGMGGATSSTSKAVIVNPSSRDEHHDVDYLFGQVSMNDQAFVDWSGNCGNLTAAVGAFAISNGWVEAVPETNGIATVRIWQANIKKTILVHVPIQDNEVQETGSFELDGVPFPGAEIQVEFLNPVEEVQDTLFPTGNVVEDLDIPTFGTLPATMINAGIPTVFINAKDVGFTGTELQKDINNDKKALQFLETIRARAAVRMGVIQRVEEAPTCQHTPKLAFVSKPQSYTTSSGKFIPATSMDLLVRALSMGQLHHAMMGTAAVATSVAAAIPGTLVHRATAGGGGAGGGSGTHNNRWVTLGHPSGTLRVGAQVQPATGGGWRVDKAMMSRSARVIMEGWVRVPA